MLLVRFATIRKASLSVAFLLLSVSALPYAEAAVDHEALLRDRLTEVRELLERRQANRNMLDVQIESLSLELDELNLKRKAALSTLSEQVDQTRANELELDRMIPKILPRLNHLERLRKQGARTIADLAKIGRESHVEAKTKARLLATRPVSIDQMRRASASVRLLRRIPNNLIGSHRDLNFQIPLLATVLDRVSSRQDRLQRRRDNAIRELANLTVDIERLTTEEHRLARNMLARSLSSTSGASAARRDRLSDQRNIGKATVGNARIKSAALGQRPSQTATMPINRTIDQTVPQAKPMMPMMPGRGVSGKTSAPAAGHNDSYSGDYLAKRPTFRKDREVAALQAAPFDSVSSRVSRGKIEEIEPLVPTGETIGYTLSDVIRRTDQTAIEIPATPKQRIATPDDGLVVFAGDFRSYGLLLIIEHDSEYHTLLWGFSSLDTGLGDRVQAGQIVGTAGIGRSPKLHVELRRNGEPVSPEVWLAASNSGVKG